MRFKFKPSLRLGALQMLADNALALGKLSEAWGGTRKRSCSTLRGLLQSLCGGRFAWIRLPMSWAVLIHLAFGGAELIS